MLFFFLLYKSNQNRITEKTEAAIITSYKNGTLKEGKAQDLLNLP